MIHLVARTLAEPAAGAVAGDTPSDIAAGRVRACPSSRAY